MKRLKFSTECRLLKINSKASDYTVSIPDEKVEIKNSFNYLRDIFNSQGNNSDLCKDWLGRDVGTSIEIISLCKEINFGKNQIFNILLLYKPVFFLDLCIFSRLDQILPVRITWTSRRHRKAFCCM